MITFDDNSIITKEFIDVDYFYEHTKDKFKIKLLSDKSGFNRKIYDQNLHRPGLALAGFLDLFAFKRVQVFGNTETRYLMQQLPEDQIKILEKIFKYDLPCIVFTNDNAPPEGFLDLANKYHIPVFGTPYTTTKIVYFLSDFLDDQFSPRVSLHGSFVDVYGVGILIMGKSGIGKSEVALDLVERGHRLVADDVTILTKKGEGILMGSGTDLTKHFMEIRGLGLINIEKMFGIRAIRYQKRLEVIVELEIWNPDVEYNRTGLDESKTTLLDVEIEDIKLPIVPGKNMTVILEVLALHYLLKHYGYDAPRVFQSKLGDLLKKKSGYSVERDIDYFEHDFE